MNADIELAKKIIERIRRYPEWEVGHNSMQFGKYCIEYYDTEEKDGYFALKFEGIEFNPKNDENFEIRAKNIQYGDINLSAWLKKIDEITSEPKIERCEVVLDGGGELKFVYNDDCFGFEIALRLVNLIGFEYADGTMLDTPRCLHENPNLPALVPKYVLFKK